MSETFVVEIYSRDVSICAFPQTDHKMGSKRPNNTSIGSTTSMDYERIFKLDSLTTHDILKFIKESVKIKYLNKKKTKEKEQE